MDKNKTQQYTFEEDEKETLEILASFENEFEAKMQEKNIELEEVKFYEKFVIKAGEIPGVFITKEKDIKGNVSYHVYYQSPENEILLIDNKGNVQINSEWREVIGDIDLEKEISKNDIQLDTLKGISKKEADSQEIKKYLKNIEDDEEPEEEIDEKNQSIEEDLKEQGEDLKISKYKKVKDNYINQRMPEVFENGTENGIAFSNKLNRFVIISKVNGQYQLNKNIEPAQITWKTIISIDENGKKVERKVPHSLMRVTNNQEKEIAVTLDEYGDVDIESVNVLPCQERVARAVRTEGEGLEGEESLEIRNEFNSKGKQYPHDIAHNVQEIEQAQRDENKTVDYDITEDDYIPNTETTWRELIQETGESLPKLIERYNREMSKAGTESKDVVKTIEDDYGNIKHEHRH